MKTISPDNITSLDAALTRLFHFVAHSRGPSEFYETLP
jgi:hypothetical protein